MGRHRRAQEAALKPALAGSLSGARIAAVVPTTPAKKRKKNASFDEERDFVAAVPKAKNVGS